MNSKDYNTIAKVFKNNATHQVAVPKIIFDLAREFKKDDDRFSPEMFFNTSGYPALMLWWNGRVKRPLAFLSRIVSVLIAIVLLTSICGAGDLSMSFNSHEFTCPCCDDRITDVVLIRQLELLREKVGKPLIITSGYRCWRYNKRVKGATHSQHIRGKAADIRVEGMTLEEVASHARGCYFSFIRIYETHVHVDVR